MKLSRKDLQTVMLTLEDMTKVNIVCQPRMYEILPIQTDEVVHRVCAKGISSPTSVYLALHYAARRNLIDVLWNIQESGFTIIKEITPDGYDYLERLHIKKAEAASQPAGKT